MLILPLHMSPEKAAGSKTQQELRAKSIPIHVPSAKIKEHGLRFSHCPQNAGHLQQSSQEHYKKADTPVPKIC